MLAAGVCLSLIAQIAEQIDYLRFRPPRTPENSRRWWTAMIPAGPGWVIFGALKQIVGLFLAVYLIANAVQTADVANQPVYQFLEIYTDIMPAWLALTLAVVLVVISQIKINALADPAGVPPGHAVPGQPGRLRFDDRLGRGVHRGVLRRPSARPSSRSRRWWRSGWPWCCRRSWPSRPRAATTYAVPTTA
jgi:hypothetical protein